MEDKDDPIDRFLMSWKGMLLFSSIFFGLYGLSAYGLRLMYSGGKKQGGEMLIYKLAKFLFGEDWAPWVVASPMAALGCMFIYAAYHDKTSVVPPEKSGKKGERKGTQLIDWASNRRKFFWGGKRGRRKCSPSCPSRCLASYNRESEDLYRV